MKRIFTFLLAIFLTATLWAQSPEKMSYQAVIRNSSNALVTNTQVGMQISILQSQEDGTVVYAETQTPTTNSNGLVSVEIGAGTVVSGDFSTINWANGPYFMKTETDPTGGANYTITGVSQLLSVPYALHAKTAESIEGTINETDPGFTSSQAANITATDITNLGNLSGTNTGDQDISGIAANAAAITDEIARATAAEETIAGDITALEAGQITQDAAIALNTAKTGITLEQATAITDNTTNIATNANAISVEEARALAAEGANAAAITDEIARATAAEEANADNITALEAGQITQDAAIALNTAKTGITTEQATAITDNTTNIATNATAISDEEARALAAEGANAAAITDEIARATAAEEANADNITALEAGQITQDAAIALNTAKTGITTEQATAITDNTTDIATLQSEQSTQNAAIAANTAKVGVTSGTAAGQMQYWNGTAWVLVAPTPNEGATLQMIGGVPTWTGGTTPPAVGDSYQGGVIFYILQSGDPGYVNGETHGLIAATSDQGLEIPWWNGSYVVTGATATALGTGSENTTLIISAQGNTGTYAAKACADYSVTVDGVTYDDWYLPSNNELNELHSARDVIPAFKPYNYLYWSSTEYDSNNAWVWYTNTIIWGIDKKWSYAVRAIRSF